MLEKIEGMTRKAMTLIGKCRRCNEFRDQQGVLGEIVQELSSILGLLNSELAEGSKTSKEELRCIRDHLISEINEGRKELDKKAAQLEELEEQLDREED